MLPDDYKLKELDSQIKQKLAEGKIEEAERLSARLIEYAENSQPQSTAVSMVSKLFNSVVAKIPTTPTPEQIAQIKAGAINEEHLRLLSLFHYFNGALSGLFSCFLLIYVGLGLMMVLNPQGFANSSTTAASAGQAGWIFFFIGAIFLSIGWGYAGLNLIAGRCLSRRKGRTLCLIVSGLNCLNAPFGSILGVSSFVVLGKPAVKTLFEGTKTAS
jgi:hypothetical protein